MRPPKAVREAARKALERRRERAAQTKRPGGTLVGVARARDLARGAMIPRATMLRMRSFFARHDTPAERKARREDPYSPAAIAWGLWGGDAGRRWVERVL